jgi:hypothetical protein
VCFAQLVNHDYGRVARQPTSTNVLIISLHAHFLTSLMVVALHCRLRTLALDCICQLVQWTGLADHPAAMHAFLLAFQREPGELEAPEQGMSILVVAFLVGRSCALA